MYHPIMDALYAQLDEMLEAAGVPKTTVRERLIYTLGARAIMELSTAVKDGQISPEDAAKLSDDLDRETADIIIPVVPPRAWNR